MHHHLKARYLIPALLALLVMIYGAVVSTRNTRENVSDFRWVAHTRGVLLSLQSLHGAVQELDLAERGFVISGDAASLKSYEPSLSLIDQTVSELAWETRDNPGQQVLVGSLREVLRLKKEEVQRVIDTRKKEGFAVSAVLIEKSEKDQFTDRFSEILAQMTHTEQALLQKREARMIQSLKDTNVTVLTANAVAVVAGITGMVLLGLFLLGRDRENKLQYEKEKAVQADQAKSEFLAMMSHEIRTPMNAILGFGELLHDSVDTPQEKHYSQAILTSGNSLLALINDILDLSKIEAAKLDINPELVDTRRFIESIHTLFSFRAAEKGLELTIENDPGVPEYLFFDALRIRQILINLVGNALKFTREGSVRLKCWCVQGEADAITLHFQVIDTGIGISQEKLSEIFRPFYQVESIYGRNYQGTGLGLSISDRLAHLMGGSITVSSELGHGSVFHAQFPVLRRTAKLEVMTSLRGDEPINFNLLAPSKILVVDDVPLNRELLQGYLHGTHHTVYEAENGEQAVLMCRKYLPDLVLMDIRMPMVDGKTALVMLREHDLTRHIPLIAVTASSLLNSQEELKSIFDGFASKPISKERLFQELDKFLPSYHVDPKVSSIPVQQETSPIPEVKGLSELLAKLEELKTGSWPSLVQLVPAQGTMNFSKQLASLALRHECESLRIYAKALEESAKTMDFQQAGSILERFPSQIEQLGSSHV